MQSIERLTEEALSLPSALRVLLVEKLIESLEFDTDPAIQAARLGLQKQSNGGVRSVVVSFSQFQENKP